MVTKFKPMSSEKIRKEIYWTFRDHIHNRHKQVSAHGSVCYVCDCILAVEKDIAELYGEKYYKYVLDKNKIKVS